MENRRAVNQKIKLNRLTEKEKYFIYALLRGCVGTSFSDEFSNIGEGILNKFHNIDPDKVQTEFN